jgi:hypothetical protein
VPDVVQNAQKAETKANDKALAAVTVAFDYVANEVRFALLMFGNHMHNRQFVFSSTALRRPPFASS